MNNLNITKVLNLHSRFGALFLYKNNSLLNLETEYTKAFRAGLRSLKIKKELMFAKVEKGSKL